MANILAWGIYTVWRSFFFAVGTMLIILGVECLVIDSATMSRKETVAAPIVTQAALFQQPPAAPTRRNKVIRPAEWIPWSLIASGSVTVLYALTLRSRRNQD